jgi:hypothetical protein
MASARIRAVSASGFATWITVFGPRTKLPSSLVNLAGRGIRTGDAGGAAGQAKPAITRLPTAAMRNGCRLPSSRFIKEVGGIVIGGSAALWAGGKAAPFGRLGCPGSTVPNTAIAVRAPCTHRNEFLQPVNTITLTLHGTDTRVHDTTLALLAIRPKLGRRGSILCECC